MDSSVSPCQGPAHCLLPALQRVTPLAPATLPQAGKPQKSARALTPGGEAVSESLSPHRGRAAAPEPRATNWLKQPWAFSL